MLRAFKAAVEGSSVSPRGDVRSMVPDLPGGYCWISAGLVAAKRL